MPVLPTDTVTVRANVTDDVAVAVTVTDVAGDCSPTLDGEAESVTPGALSSSVKVTVVPVTERPVALPATPMVSLPS